MGQYYSSPVSVTRTQALCADGQSDLLLSMSTVPMTIELPGAGAMRAEPGDAVLLSQARPVRLIYQKAGPTWVLRVPHADVARMLPRLSAAPVLVLRKGTPMLQLLQKLWPPVAYRALGEHSEPAACIPAVAGDAGADAERICSILPSGPSAIRWRRTPTDSARGHRREPEASHTQP